MLGFGALGVFRVFGFGAFFQGLRVSRGCKGMALKALRVLGFRVLELRALRV